MILGIGLDIVEIERFKRLIGNDAFMSRVFSCGERAYILHKGAQSAQAAAAAGMFCAKEALSKALGCGLTRSMLEEAEVTHDGKGAPRILLSGSLGERFSGRVFHLSISHTGSIASAVVVCERFDGKEGEE